jgi:hypothetical protein
VGVSLEEAPQATEVAKLTTEVEMLRGQLALSERSCEEVRMRLHQLSVEKEQELSGFVQVPYLPTPGRCKVGI